MIVLFCRKSLVNELCVNCSSCGRSFDLKCSGIDGPLDDKETCTWLCKVCVSVSFLKDFDI